MKAWIVALVAMSVSAPAFATEGPMPVTSYAELCQRSGGVFTSHLTSGLGTAQCSWSGHGRTECKVGAGNVNICAILCQSNACLKENPARRSPQWPLQGGPNSAPLPVQPGGGTLAPAN